MAQILKLNIVNFGIINSTSNGNIFFVLFFFNSKFMLIDLDDCKVVNNSSQFLNSSSHLNVVILLLSFLYFS